MSITLRSAYLSINLNLRLLSPDDMYSNLQVVDADRKALADLPRKLGEIAAPNAGQTISRIAALLEYDDGTADGTDPSHMADTSVLQSLEKTRVPDEVWVDSYGAITRGDEIDIRRYVRYMEFTGKTWEELPEEVAAAVDDDLNSTDSMA